MAPRTRSKASVEPKEVKKTAPKAKTAPAAKGSLALGDPIPDITLLNQEGEEVSLVELAKLKPLLVIFAYPKASTPGCTRQACGFRDNYSSLQKHATVVGISKDSPKAQLNFKTKQKLTYDLLCDPKAQLIKPLGADKPGSTIRSHWVFKNSKLVKSHVQISPEQSVKKAAEEIEELK